ncbi:uncharacterized protein LOC131076454 [Cryptomeria japonica]|uniref:uncharacterized protein LOC131076454 n=1 Tax=Cryptomeria japonica TaxID=3369 RepID=UPI0027DAB18D|nr:uncharacterized protein LOC131076454 [Cryptomeria japonica]
MGSRAGICLTSPSKEHTPRSLCFQFPYSNSEAEYEELSHRLNLTKWMGIKQLRVLGDSELVVKQVRGQSAAKHVRMRSYQHRLWDLIEIFEDSNIQGIPRRQNVVFDRLSTVVSQFDPASDLLENKHSVQVIVRPVVPDND